MKKGELITAILQVWEAKEDVKKTPQDIPIHIWNILEEIHFEDELTRSRCRGWLVYPSRRYLQADILFPGCEFDCRLTIRGRAGGVTEVIIISSCIFLQSFKYFHLHAIGLNASRD